MHNKKVLTVLSVVAIVGLTGFLMLIQMKQKEKTSETRANAIENISTEASESTETIDLGDLKTEDGKPVVQFSKESGFYADDITVSIAATEDTTIYYTVDGSIPNEESEKYEGSFVVTNISGNDNVLSAESDISTTNSYVPSYDVDKGNIFRAIAVDKDGNTSDVVTAEYYINVGEKSEYSNLPIISIVSEPDDLMDYYTGIYRLGRSYEDALASESEITANYLEKKSIDTYVSVYDNDHKADYSIDGSLSIYKDVAVDSNQKSLLITNSEGERILLSNMETDSSFKLRQNVANAFFEDSDIVTVDYEPYMVFIDGEFWGMYQRDYEFTPEYVASKTGEDVSNILTAIDGKVSDPKKQENFSKLYKFVTTHKLSKKDNYEIVCNMMDVDSYITYVAANIYLANSDSDITNYSWYSKKSGKWYWALGDMRGALDANNLSTPSIDTYLRPSITQNLFLNHLMQNKDFSSKFEKTVLEMHDKYFSEAKSEKVIEEITNSYAKAVASNYSRYYGSVTVEAITPELEYFKEFVESRNEYISVYTEEYMSGISKLTLKASDPEEDN